MCARQTACANDTGCGTSLILIEAWEQGCVLQSHSFVLKVVGF